MQPGLPVRSRRGGGAGSDALPVGRGGGATLRRSTLGRAVVRALLAVCCLTAPFRGATAVGAARAWTGATTMADNDGITLNFASSGGGGACSSLKRKLAPGITGTEARRMTRMPRRGKPKREKKKNDSVGPAFPDPKALHMPAVLQPLRGGGRDWEDDDDRPRG
ncbi:hypothetical protein T484DRAFT_1921582, partial [Baffinella frigidus]